MTKGTPHQLLFSDATRAALSVQPADLVFFEEAEVRGRTGTVKLWSVSEKPSDIYRLDASPATVQNAPGA
jgi:class 3 adenylate cyclase